MPTYTGMIPRLAACAVLLCACGGTAPVQPSEPSVLQLDVDATFRETDPAEIREAEIVGDELRLLLRYGGGCREHEFTLFYSGIFRESQPVQTDVRLAHDARGDVCRALLERHLAFDISPLKRAWQNSYQMQNGAIDVHLYPPAVAPGQERPILRYIF